MRPHFHYGPSHNEFTEQHTWPTAPTIVRLMNRTAVHSTVAWPPPSVALRCSSDSDWLTDCRFTGPCKLWTVGRCLFYLAVRGWVAVEYRDTCIFRWWDPPGCTNLSAEPRGRFSTCCCCCWCWNRTFNSDQVVGDRLQSSDDLILANYHYILQWMKLAITNDDRTILDDDSVANKLILFSYLVSSLYLFSLVG